MAQHEDGRYQVIWLTRRLFRALAREAEAYLLPFGITAAERAVLEFLDHGGAAAVPEIARQHDVSRQHIQVTVNTLLEKGLVETRPNPRHRRSPFVQATAQGCRAFSAIRHHESQRIEVLFAGVDSADLKATGATLERLLHNLNAGKVS